MSTCNRLDLHRLGSQLIMPKISPITSPHLCGNSFLLGTIVTIPNHNYKYSDKVDITFIILKLIDGVPSLASPIQHGHSTE